MRIMIRKATPREDQPVESAGGKAQGRGPGTRQRFLGWSGQRRQRVTETCRQGDPQTQVGPAEWAGLLRCGLSILKPGQSQAKRGDMVPVDTPHSVL